jgi:hypothetical protein
MAFKTDLFFKTFKSNMFVPDKPFKRGLIYVFKPRLCQSGASNSAQV